MQTKEKTIQEFLHSLLQPVVEDSVRKVLQEFSSSPPEASNAEKYLTAQEAADYLNLSVNTLYGLTSRKKIPFYKRSGKKLYFKKDDIDYWLSEGRQPTREETQKSGLEKIQKRHQQ